MTDRHSGYVVVLDKDIREDDAEAVITALKMIKGVVGVKPVISGIELEIAQARVDREWRAKLYALLTKE